MHLSIKNFLSNLFNHDIKKWSLLLSIFMIFWSPFSGGARSGMLILAFLGIYKIITAKQKVINEIPIQRWMIIFLALWIPLIFSLFNTINTINTMVAISWFSLIFFSGVSILQALSIEKYRVKFSKSLVYIVFLWAHLSIIQLIFWPSFMPVSPEGRVSGLFYDLHQGCILLLITPAAYYALREANKNILSLYLLFISCFVTIASGSRIYLYMILLSFLLHLVTNKINIKKTLYACIGLIAITFLTYFSNNTLIEKKFNDSLSIFSIEDSKFNRLDKTLTGRLTLWDAGKSMFISSPISGVGAKNYREAFPLFSKKDTLFKDFNDPKSFPSHSHNIYIQLLSELGLVGGFGLIFIFILSYRWYRNSDITQRKNSWPFIFPLLIIFFPINSTQPILTPWLLPLIILFYLGFLGSLTKVQKTNALP